IGPTSNFALRVNITAKKVESWEEQLLFDTTLSEAVETFLENFGKALQEADIERALELFQEECYWRDLVSFTWNIKTLEGKDQVAEMLRHQLEATRPYGWKLAEGEAP